MAWRFQVVPERAKTYTVPVILPFLADVTKIVPPYIARAPRCSLDAWGRVRVACRFQVEPVRTNTYTAPAKDFLPTAPTTAVEPDRHRPAELVIGSGVGRGQLALLDGTAHR